MNYLPRFLYIPVLFAILFTSSSWAEAYDCTRAAHRIWEQLSLDWQICIGSGIQFHWSEDGTVGVAYEYLDIGEAEID